MSSAVDVISQSDRAGKRLFQRANRVKRRHTASTVNCTQLILPFSLLTHTLHIYFITIFLQSLGDGAQCHSIYGKTHLKKNHCWAQVMRGKPEMRAICHYLPIPVCPRCEFHVTNSSLCPCSDLWSRFGYRRGVTRLRGTPSSLQTSPVRNPTGTGVELQQSPAEKLCLNSVSLYYPT